MAASIIEETTIALRFVPTLFPPTSPSGGKMHIATVNRWATRGKRLRDGTVLRLEAIKCGSAWITSREAVQRFVERLTNDALGIDSTEQPAPIRTPAQRSRAISAADAELQRIGA